MNLPNSIEIGGIDVRFEWVDDLTDPDGQDCWGETSSASGSILLDRSLRNNPKRLFSTVIHELMHAISSEYLSFGGDLSEQQVESMTLGFVEVYRQLGPWLEKARKAAYATG